MGGWYKSGQFWPIYVSNEEMRKKCAAFYDHYNTLEQTYIMYTYKAACSNNISQSSYKKYTILQAWQYYSEEMAAKWSEIYKKLFNLGKKMCIFWTTFDTIIFSTVLLKQQHHNSRLTRSKSETNLYCLLSP